MNIQNLLKQTGLHHDELVTMINGVSKESLEIALKAFPNSAILKAFYVLKIRLSNPPPGDPPPPRSMGTDLDW